MIIVKFKKGISQAEYTAFNTTDDMIKWMMEQRGSIIDYIIYKVAAYEMFSITDTNKVDKIMYLRDKYKENTTDKVIPEDQDMLRGQE